MRKVLFIFFFLNYTVLFSQTLVGSGQIILDGSGTYVQNFDILANSGSSNVLPEGWYFIESGSNANTLYTAGTGSSNTGDTYSFGQSGSSERAFGGLLSGSLIPTIGAKLINNTGFTITQIPISYYGEMWRLGATGRFDSLVFEYSLDADSLNNGTWIKVDSLSFVSPDTSAPAGARDGNNSNYRTLLNYVITGLNIPNGSTFWIRWRDYNASGADDGLAVDSFQIDESALPVQLTSFNYLLKNNSVQLLWSTATEVNNYGFEIEKQKIILKNKAIDEAAWKTIGFIQGNGNSNSLKTYSFIDRDITNGKYIYRLKQIDFDGKYEYSKILEVYVKLFADDIDLLAYPNPFNPITRIRYSIPEFYSGSKVTLKLFDILGKEIKTLVNEINDSGKYEIEFNGKDLSSGVYLIKLEVNNKILTQKLIIQK